MGDARQERRQGWQVGRGRWAAGSVNYDFDGWRRRGGGLLLLSLFPLSPLSGSLAVLDDRKGSRRLSGAGRLAGWLCPGAGADDRQAGRVLAFRLSCCAGRLRFSLRLSVLSLWPSCCVSAMAGGRLCRCRDDLRAVPGALAVLGLAVAVLLGSLGRKSSGMVYVKMHKNKASKSRYFYMLD